MKPPVDSEIEFSADEIARLEGKLTDLLNDCIEVEYVGTFDDHYCAVIRYDGTNNEANKGYVYFTCKRFVTRPELNGLLEDFDVLNLTGRNYLPHNLELIG